FSPICLLIFLNLQSFPTRTLFRSELSMFGTDLYIALVLGVVLSLLFTERTGIIPAGLVVPGYLALIFDQPIFIVVILFVIFLTYLIVHFGISLVTILYGSIKFDAILITNKLNFQEKIQLFTKKQKKKTGRQAVLGLFVTGFLIFTYVLFAGSSVAKVEDKDNEFTASFVGDMMFGRHVNDVIEERGT